MRRSVGSKSKKQLELCEVIRAKVKANTSCRTRWRLVLKTLICSSIYYVIIINLYKFFRIFAPCSSWKFRGFGWSWCIHLNPIQPLWKWMQNVLLKHRDVQQLQRTEMYNNASNWFYNAAKTWRHPCNGANALSAPLIFSFTYTCNDVYGSGTAYSSTVITP